MLKFTRILNLGDKWKMHRRILTPSFHFAILENFIEIFENNGDILIQRLEAEIPKNSFNIYPPINLCALDIICGKLKRNNILIIIIIIF